jgi:hypothetical protein
MAAKVIEQLSRLHTKKAKKNKEKRYRSYSLLIYIKQKEESIEYVIRKKARREVQ